MTTKFCTYCSCQGFSQINPQTPDNCFSLCEFVVVCFPCILSERFKFVELKMQNIIPCIRHNHPTQKILSIKSFCIFVKVSRENAFMFWTTFAFMHSHDHSCSHIYLASFLLKQIWKLFFRMKEEP